MPLFAVQYPNKYRTIFDPLNDFEVYNLNTEGVKLTPNSHKPVWVDFSVIGAILDSSLEPYQGIILPCYPNADLNVLQASKAYILGKWNIGIWRGEKRHLKLMEQAVDIVALPYYEAGRTLKIEPGMSGKYHYYGFCNLEELRKHPPASLHTSCPITAAMVGIDLAERERRPKKLPEFNYNLTLSESQLELAYNNALAIKGVLNEK